MQEGITLLYSTLKIRETMEYKKPNRSWSPLKFNQAITVSIHQLRM